MQRDQISFRSQTPTTSLRRLMYSVVGNGTRPRDDGYPPNEAGNIVGKVLHVGTGYPRLMVATVDTCGGPRAYAGLVYAYHEEVTENFERLTDQTWAGRFASGGARPADVPWMRPMLTP